MDTCPGPNITHYLVQISFQNGPVTDNVNITECTAERCSHTFKLPSNPPSSYDRVSVAAENMMGVGDARTCTAQTISESYSLTVITYVSITKRVHVLMIMLLARAQLLLLHTRVTKVQQACMKCAKCCEESW